MIEIVNKYGHLKSNISHYIDKSGYKNSFLAEKIGVGNVAFSRKKGQASFSYEQIQKMSKYIFSEDTLEKNKIVHEVIKKSLAQAENGETVNNKDVKRWR